MVTLEVPAGTVGGRLAHAQCEPGEFNDFVTAGVEPADASREAFVKQLAHLVANRRSLGVAYGCAPSKSSSCSICARVLGDLPCVVVPVGPIGEV